MVTTDVRTETGPAWGKGHGPVSLGAGPESGTGPDWLSVTEAAARAGVQERSIRRMIARGAVVSQRTPDGRRLVLAESLPGQDRGQDRGHGPVRGDGHGPDPGQRQDPGQDSGQDLAREQLQRERAMVDFLQLQLQQSRDAERELRLLLAQATKTAQLLADRPQLPAAAPPAKVRWWNPATWRR